MYIILHFNFVEAYSYYLSLCDMVDGASDDNILRVARFRSLPGSLRG